MACLVTGANGHLGRRLVRELAGTTDVVALVRSHGARDRLRRHTGDLERVGIVLGNPSDPDDIARIAAGCDRAVHLIGTIRATQSNSLSDAHETTAAAFARAAERVGIRQAVYVSILGAAADSASACLRARASVEAMLRAANFGSTVIRVPMVLGERDRASFALAKRAHARRTVVFRAASLEQPIYAGDVIAALVRALGAGPDAERDAVYELAGPRSLSRRDLIIEAGRAVGNVPEVVSLPLVFGMAFAGALELTRPEPPLTRDMLRILDHDDAIDPGPAVDRLGISLTPLDEMLRRCIVGRLDTQTTTS